ncbi:phosphatase PAP2 family protein [Rubritalea marina]|uniref:phosphatase PAP2 family protein n=1 Tax=Rubritalea marina TaxID=361055 RepID=UPI00035F3D67|nr:phosphatase PAP2 family protein [Rubritalea marina]
MSSLYKLRKVSQKSAGVFGAALVLGSSAQAVKAESEDTLRDIGDVLQFALPGAGGIATLFERDSDWEGSKQWLKTMGTSLGTQVAIKFVVDKTRPSNGTQSFPSGHTAGAFSGAAFIERRYGWGWGIPAYGLAGLTAYSRVNADVHDTWDVIGGAAIGTLSAYIHTTPYRIGNKDLKVKPDLKDGYYGFKFSLSDHDPDAYADNRGAKASLSDTFGNWFTGPLGQGRSNQVWTGSDPTRIQSFAEFRFDMIDQSQNLNRNSTNFTGYAPRLRGNWAFREDMMIGAEIGYTWNKLDDLDTSGFGDTQIDYLWRFYDKEPQNNWSVRAASLGLDQLIPTGDAEKNLGGDSWIVRPKLTGAWSPWTNLNLYTTASWYESLHDGDNSFLKTSAGSLEFQIEYKFENGVYAFWRPEFLYLNEKFDFEDEFVANHLFELGFPVFDKGVLYYRYNLLANPLSNVAPVGAYNRPRFYDDIVSLGYRHKF